MGWRGRLAALVVLFVVAAWIQGRVLPPFEGGDEWLQVAYIEHWRTTGTLPDRADALSPVRQQSGQPPLTYALNALPSMVLRLPPIDTVAMWNNLQAASNNWYAPPDRFNRTDNNNVFYRTNAPANTTDMRRVLFAARMVAPLYGVVALGAAYGVGYEAFRSHGWALTVAAVFAFTPTLLHVNTFITTDGGAVAGGAVVLWLALRAMRRGLRSIDAAWLGLALGLAGLAKVNALLLGPTVAAAILVASHTWAARVRHALVALVPFALTSGAWMAWGWLVYRDPFGTSSHHFPGQHFDPPLGPIAVLSRMPEVYLSYWGKFASAVYLHPATYAALTVWLLLALAGYALPRGDVRPMRGRVLLVLTVLVGFAGLWYWVATVNFITGRLLFPAHGALVVVVVGGWRRWSRYVSPMWARSLAVVPLAVITVVLVPLVIARAYAVPDARTSAALSPVQVDYADTMRLVAWHAPDTITSDTLATVTLCWHVLQETERPAAYALKLVRDGVPVGERTTVHGLGRYDSTAWAAGYQFCDAVDVSVGTVERGAAYDVLVVMLDAQTGAVDWPATTGDGTPLPFPVLGQVVGD